MEQHSVMFNVLHLKPRSFELSHQKLDNVFSIFFFFRLLSGPRLDEAAENIKLFTIYNLTTIEKKKSNRAAS